MKIELYLFHTEMTLNRLPAAPFSASKFCFAFFVSPNMTFMAIIQAKRAQVQSTKFTNNKLELSFRVEIKEKRIKNIQRDTKIIQLQSQFN